MTPGQRLRLFALPGSGPGGRRFKSFRPDHFLQALTPNFVLCAAPDTGVPGTPLAIAPHRSSFARVFIRRITDSICFPFAPLPRLSIQLCFSPFKPEFGAFDVYSLLNSVGAQTAPRSPLRSALPTIPETGTPSALFALLATPTYQHPLFS